MSPDRPGDVERFDRFRADYLRHRPPRRHANVAFNPRQAGKRQALVELVAAELLEGLTPYVDRRPRHLAPGSQTLSIASPNVEESRAVLEEARTLAEAWVGRRASRRDGQPGRHEAGHAW